MVNCITTPRTAHDTRLKVPRIRLLEWPADSLGNHIPAAMDAAEEDQDVRLQRASSDLLADLEGSLEPFLWKKSSPDNRRIRRRVRVRETERLIALVRAARLMRLLPLMSVV